MLKEESGLGGDLCISRPKSRLDWGIELPFDKDYVCYVWFDALINYLTGIGYPDGDNFESLWSGAEHIIAKDILKPHAIFWPCMLRAIGLPPPRHLNVHGYWTVDERKVSKSLGNMISPRAIKEKYGFEPFRYFLLREMSFGVDSNFSEELMVSRVNADLANNLGNLVSRTLNMVQRFAEGKVPQPGPAGELEHAIEETARRIPQEVDAAMRTTRPHRALEAMPPTATSKNANHGSSPSRKAAWSRFTRRFIPAARPYASPRYCFRPSCRKPPPRSCGASAILRISNRPACPMPPAGAAYASVLRRKRASPSFLASTSTRFRNRKKNPALRAQGESPEDEADIPMWLDSHCHLTADRYSEDRSDVIARAREAGVEAMIAIGSGYGFQGNIAAVELARREADIHATVGVHPHEASEFAPGQLDQLRGWLADPRVVALGECGLDYHYMNSDRDAQRSAFAAQIGLARELGVPVSIHVRGDEPDAFAEMLDIWLAEGQGELAGVLHCYTGTREFAHRALDAGFMVSFSGIVTFKRSDALREVARSIPLERLMVETDAPFLAPEGHRGERNEPAWVNRVGEQIAELHGKSAEEIGRITSENARRFYRLAH